MPINQQTAEEAYNSVLEHAGASMPKRDAVDLRIIEEARTGTANFEGCYEDFYAVADKSMKCGIIDSQNDVGGWPELESVPAPTDSDHDGIPDEWEDKNNLDKENPNDRNTFNSDGYTMLEVYINSLI